MKLRALIIVTTQKIVAGTFKSGLSKILTPDPLE
jgi:hypothetical protein